MRSPRVERQRNLLRPIHLSVIDVAVANLLTVNAMAHRRDPCAIAVRVFAPRPCRNCCNGGAGAHHAQRTYYDPRYVLTSFPKSRKKLSNRSRTSKTVMAQRRLQKHDPDAMSEHLGGTCPTGKPGAAYTISNASAAKLSQACDRKGSDPSARREMRAHCLRNVIPDNLATGGLIRESERRK